MSSHFSKTLQKAFRLLTVSFLHSYLSLLCKCWLRDFIVSVDPMTGRNPSYCFVDFANKDLAERVMEEYNGREFMRRPLKVKPGVKSGTGKGRFDMPPRNNESRHVPQISNFPTFVHILVWFIRVEWVIENQLLKKIECLEIHWGNELTYPSGTCPSLCWLASFYFFSKSSKWIEWLLTPGLSSPTYNRWNKLEAPESVNTAAEEGRRLYVGGLPRFESQEESDAQIRGLFESVGFKPEGIQANSF